MLLIRGMVIFGSVDIIRIIPTAAYGKDRLSQPANRVTQITVTER
jgi:hypothetical protein